MNVIEAMAMAVRRRILAVFLRRILPQASP
jgi:hypothetical protein